MSKKEAGRRSGCPTEGRLVEDWIRGEPSLERELFLLHAASCPRCSRRLELADELWKELAPHLNRIPEVAPTAAEARALRRAAREEIRRMGGDTRRPSSAPWASPLRLAAAALAVVLAAGAVFLLTRPGRREVYRTETASVEHSMSPQGVLNERPSVFEWSPLPGAVAYAFEMIDENLEVLAWRERSPERRFVLPDEARSRLTSGHTYIWTVIDIDENYIELGERSASFSLR